MIDILIFLTYHYKIFISIKVHKRIIILIQKDFKIKNYISFIHNQKIYIESVN